MNVADVAKVLAEVQEAGFGYDGQHPRHRRGVIPLPGLEAKGEEALELLEDETRDAVVAVNPCARSPREEAALV